MIGHFTKGDFTLENSKGLDSLIRKVDGMKAPHRNGEEVIVPVLINPNRKPWEWKKEEFYLVAKRPDHFSEGTCVVSIIAFTEGLQLDLSIAYRVRMSDAPLQSAAQSIAVKLYDPLGPQVALENRIAKWVLDYVDKNGGPYRFIEGYIEHVPIFRQEMQRWARESLSLDLHLLIEIRTEKKVDETEEIPAFTVKAIFRDNDRVVDLKVENLTLEYAADPRQRIFAYVRSGETAKLTRLLQEKLVEVIRKDYDLHQFRGYTVPTTIKQAIKDRLNETTTKFGRTIRVLDLRCQTPFFEAEDAFSSTRFTFFVTVPQFPKRAEVYASIQLQLSALGKFAASGVTNLDQWAEAALKSTIVPHVSRHSYLELVTQWDTEKTVIDEELKAKAAEIGYKLLHTIIETDLPFDSVRRPFQIKLDRAFTTKNSESTVTIHMDAHIKIVNMSLLASKMSLATEINIDQRVNESLTLVLQQVAKNYSPKAWHLYFDTHPEATPLKFVVEKAIQRDLEESFGGTLVSINITRDSDLVGVLAKLREQTPRLIFEVTREQYKTELAYRVLDVEENDWQRFEATKPSIEQLNERVELHVKQMFADQDPAVFRRISNYDIIYNWIGSKDEKGIPFAIRNQYGLNIYIDHWIRERIDVEKGFDKLRVTAEEVTLDQQNLLLQATRAEQSDDLAWLRQRKSDIREQINKLHVLDDAEEINKLKAQIDELNREIRAQSPEALRNIMEENRIGAERQLAVSLGQDGAPPTMRPDRQLNQSVDNPPDTSS
jgi:hypothetical protein